MKPTLDCVECFLRQAVRAARIATPDTRIQERITLETARHISTMDLSKSPAELSLCIYDTTARLSGVRDPYLTQKREQNALALTFEPELRRLVAQSDDPLDTALHIAAAGNVIDLGTQQEIDIDVRATLDQVLHERFAVDHSDAFRTSLAGCRDLLYLIDNAGEILFDKILIEELQKHTRVTAVVKSGPILNDATIADAEKVGLTQVCDVIELGGAFIGAPLSLVPAPFLERMHAADVIIGKGQGHFETIDEFPSNVFLILKAKCGVVAEQMGVALGQVGLISTRVRAAAAHTSI